MKARDHGLVHNLLIKASGSHLIEDVKQKELRWCQKTWMQEIMVPKCELYENIPLHIQRLNYGEGVHELNDCVGGETLSSNLPLELGPIKKIPLASFSNCLLKIV